MKKCLLIITVMLALLQAHAQVAINTTGQAAVSSSMLDVSSTSKGMLMPRMTTAQRKAISNPEIGLLVFDTDRHTIYFFDGQKWKPMIAGTEATAPLASREVTGARQFSGFGYAADIYGNYAIVGAPYDTAKGVQGGAAYIFEKNNGQWSQVYKISAQFPTALEGFGKAVSISNEYIVIGAPEKTVSGAVNRGAIYVFKRFNRTWSYVTMLTASNGLTNDKFGYSVATDGNFIASGAPFRNHSNVSYPGSVYIFGLVNNTWEQKAIVNASDPFADAKFGNSLDLEQAKLVVGAPAAQAGSGNVLTNGGAVYVYNRSDVNGLTWTFIQKLHPGGYTHNNMKFGASVAIEDNLIAIGAPDYSSVPGSDINLGRGALVRFTWVNGSWTLLNLIPESNDFHKLGTSVALINGVYMAGMPGSLDNRGKVMILDNIFRYVYDDDPHQANKFGTVVAGHNGHFLITAPYESQVGRVFFGVLD